MPVKPRIDEARQDKANERLDKQMARIYLIWLIGIVVGAIHLRPEKVEYGGLSYIIESPEKLQGIIFFGCLVYYLGLFGNVILFGLQNFTTNHTLKRRIIYAALGKKRTLSGLGRVERLALRLNAKVYYTLAISVLAFIALMPALHILFVQQAVLLTGIDAIFQSVSLKDGHINPDAPATLILSLLLMIAWTIFIWRILNRLLGTENKADLVFLNGLAAITFAYLDSRLRTGETFTEALPRAIGLQTTILFLCFLPRIIAFPFQMWSSGYLAYLKWKLKRVQKKQWPRKT